MIRPSQSKKCDQPASATNMQQGSIHKQEEGSSLKSLTPSQVEQPLKKGFLKKQGGNHKNWKKRFFILTTEILYYFKSNDPQAKLKGIIKIGANSMLRESTLSKKKHAFDLTVLGRTFVLQALSIVEMKLWMRAIEAVINPPQKQQQDAEGDGGHNSPPNGNHDPMVETSEQLNTDQSNSSETTSPRTTEKPQLQNERLLSKTSNNIGVTETITLRSVSNNNKTEDAALAPEQEEGDENSGRTETVILRPPVFLLENTYPRLLRVNANKALTSIVSVPACSASLNTRDLFLLDNGKEIFQWTPKGSSLFEKGTAARICRHIDSFRGGMLHITVITEADTSDSGRFWTLLGGKPDVLSDQAGTEVQGFVELFGIETAESGQFEFSSVHLGKKLDKQLLDTTKVMLFDCGFEVYVWIGLASKKYGDMAVAQILKQYLAMNAKVDTGSIFSYRVFEGGKNGMMEFYII